MTDRPSGASEGCTPSQTVGPFLAIVLPWPDGPELVAEGTPGRIRIAGVLTDGAGDPVPDGLVEIWQADPDGRFDHPDDPRGALGRSGWRGFGRCATDEQGRFAFHTVKPAGLPAESGSSEAPHLDVSVFARGLLNRVVTRIYFADEEEANSIDPVLASLPERDRQLLIATPDGPGSLRFDICLQGERETPFFAI
jgi:protocatechuate 3,4-dioxygenase alpha subunit